MAIPRLLNQAWLKKQPENARRRARNLGLLLMSQMIIGVAAIYVASNQSSYFKVHGGLFIISLLAIVAVFIGRAEVTTMFRHLWSTLAGHEEAGLTEITDSLRVLSLAIAIVSLIFVVDLSFFREGFRLGGAAAVSIFLVFKALIERWQAARRP